jgi:hypothetical protein
MFSKLARSHDLSDTSIASMSGEGSSYNALVGVLGVRGEISMLFGRMASVMGVRVNGGGSLDGPPSASSFSMKDGRGERAFSGGRAVKVVELLSLYEGRGSC